MLSVAAAALIAAGVSAAGSIGGMFLQNFQQRRMYEDYMSPQARMQQMMEAGINPAAAAQGISGSSAPGMSAASPNAALSGLGSYISSIPQLAAEIDRLKSDTSKNQAEEKYFESLTTGKDIENKFNFETFEERIKSLNLDNNQKSYIIDTLRPYAEHADEWYKINFDQLDETVKKTRKEISEIDEKIKNLIEEREVMETQEGLNIANANESNARAALEKQKKELIDSLGGEDVESAYVIARVKGDDKRANAIKDGVQDYVEAESKGAYNGDPVHREFQNAAEAREELPRLINQYIQEQKELSDAFLSGRISKNTYLEYDKKYSANIKQLQHLLRKAEYAFSDQAYKNGYHTWWQDNATSLINSASTLGSAAIHVSGMKKFGTQSSIKTPVFDMSRPYKQ